MQMIKILNFDALLAPPNPPPKMANAAKTADYFANKLPRSSA